MKGLPVTKAVVALLLAVTLLFGATGCGTDLESMILDLLGDWADAHDVNPSTVDGAINLAGRAASGSTGNEEADAAIGASKLIKDIQKGDELMEKGRQQHDAAAMDEAIALRPDDTTYRVSRATVALENNDIVTAQQQYVKAEEIRQEEFPRARDLASGKVAQDRYYRQLQQQHLQVIDELESGSIRVRGMNDETRAYYYARLAREYDLIDQNMGLSRAPALERPEYQAYVDYKFKAQEIWRENRPASDEWEWSDYGEINSLWNP